MPATGDERRLVVALAEPRMMQLEDIEPIKQALRYAMTLVGLRPENWPRDEEKLLLIGYIASQYGGHTASEIRLAFEMAVAGRLDCDVNPYENFSVRFFAQVMNAYRKWSEEAARQLRPPEPPPHTYCDWYYNLMIALNAYYKIDTSPYRVMLIAPDPYRTGMLRLAATYVRLLVKDFDGFVRSIAQHASVRGSLLEVYRILVNDKKCLPIEVMEAADKKKIWADVLKLSGLADTPENKPLHIEIVKALQGLSAFVHVEKMEG